MSMFVCEWVWVYEILYAILSPQPEMELLAALKFHGTSFEV